MRQQIYIRQYNQLKEEAKVEYHNWLSSKGYAVKNPWNNKLDFLLTLGQMIEFLEENCGIIYIKGKLVSEHKGDWGVELAEGSRNTDYAKEELADTLWEAVKDQLNQIEKQL